ncbi:MAG: hypothetical protein WCA10_11485 [Terracidiphilus sp.]
MEVAKTAEVGTSGAAIDQDGANDCAKQYDVQQLGEYDRDARTGLGSRIGPPDCSFSLILAH